MSIRKHIRRIEAQGWDVVFTGGGHLRCTHPLASRPVFASVSPSDGYYAQRKLDHDLRKALREGEVLRGMRLLA